MKLGSEKLCFQLFGAGFEKVGHGEGGLGSVVMTAWKYLVGWRWLWYKNSHMSDWSVSVEISNWMALAVA